MEAILDFIHNAMSKIISGHTIISGISENPMVQMEAISDFTHNAMSKIISGHTIISGISENPMVQTKVMNRLMIYRNLYQFNLCPWSKRRPFSIFAFEIDTW